MRAAHIMAGVFMVLSFWLFLLFWIACIWTTGQDPLSIKFGYTSVVFFFVALFSGGVWAAMWEIRE